MVPLTEQGTSDAGGRMGDHASWPSNSSERLPWTQGESVTSRSLADGCGCDMLAQPLSRSAHVSLQQQRGEKGSMCGQTSGSRSDLGRNFPVRQFVVWLWALFSDAQQLPVSQGSDHSVTYLIVFIQFLFCLGWTDWVLLFANKSPAGI